MLFFFFLFISDCQTFRNLAIEPVMQVGSFQSLSPECVTLAHHNQQHYVYRVCILQLFTDPFRKAAMIDHNHSAFAWSHLVRFASALITSPTGVILTRNSFLCPNFIINTLYDFFHHLTFAPSASTFKYTFKHCLKNLLIFIQF